MTAFDVYERKEEILKIFGRYFFKKKLFSSVVTLNKWCDEILFM